MSDLHTLREVSGVGFSPDKTQVAFSKNNIITLWNLNTGEEIYLNGDTAGQAIGKELLPNFNPFHPKAIKAIALSPNGKLLATGSRDNNLCLWNLEKESKCTQKYNVPNIKGIGVLRFNPAGTQIAVSSIGDGKICLLDLQRAQIAGNRTIYEKEKELINNLGFNNDGSLLAFESEIRKAGLPKISKNLIDVNKKRLILSEETDSDHIDPQSDVRIDFIPDADQKALRKLVQEMFQLALQRKRN